MDLKINQLIVLKLLIVRTNLPALEIDLKKIHNNAKILKKTFDSKNVSIFGIAKGVLGNPEIAKVIQQAGIDYLGDSRIDNIIKMREAGINAKYVYIRNPTPNKIPLIIKYTDISLNSELNTIKKLSEEALRQSKKHGVLLMVEMGDLREGIMPDDLEDIVKKIIHLSGIELLGIGTNLKCFAGIIPDKVNMKEFSDIAAKIQDTLGLKLKFISGGNSANYDWLMSVKDTGLINNLRIGTAILLGLGGIHETPLNGLNQDAFIFIAEIIEIKRKPFYPKGTMTLNAFGEPSIFKSKDKLKKKKSFRNQALLNVGRQDIQETGLVPLDYDIEIMGASSDYIIIDIKENDFKLGDKLRFSVNYEALLCAMTSPFISKIFTKE